MKRVLATSAAIGLSLVALTGCSGSGDYCKTLRRYAEQGAASSKDPDAVSKAADQVKDLQSKAPDDLKDDWSLLVEVMNAADSKDSNKLKELQARKAQIEAAAKAISDHAESKCKVRLTNVAPGG